MAIPEKPITRKEQYYARIAGETNAIPAPVTRVEKYLAHLAGMAAELPEPITRKEQYLFALCNGTGTVPKPITRMEMIMARAFGLDAPEIQPVTREERYWTEIAGIWNPDVVPVTLGIYADFTNGTFERLGDGMGKNGGDDFDGLPMYGLRRCNLADDGTVNAYYGEAAYTEDGNNGQVMVEMPKFYYRMEPLELDNSNVMGSHIRKANYYISNVSQDGFKLHPAFLSATGEELDKVYYSAYEGSLYDASAREYILDDAQIMAATEDTLCSISGAKPASGKTQQLTMPNLETLSNNRGDGWHITTIQLEMAVTLLMAVEYATFDFQFAIGNGVVSITDDPNTENLSIPTGGTQALGNHSGMASGSNGKVSVSWRGIENSWGNIWQFVNGLNIWGDGSMAGGQPYINSDFSFNYSKRDGNYEAVGFTLPNANGYISAFGYGKEKFDWLFLASETSGGTNKKPVGDYFYVTPNLNAFRVARVGGCWYNVLSAGRSDWVLDNGVGGRLRSVGGRLAYIR